MLTSRSQSNLSMIVDNAIGIIPSSHPNLPSIVHAVSSEDLTLTQHLLAASSTLINVPVDGKKQKRYTILHVSCKLTGPTGPVIVNLLLENGADVNARDRRGFTPLDWCVERMMEHPESTSIEEMRVLREVVNILVGAKADINSKDAEGKTLMQRARAYGWKKQDRGFAAGDHLMAFLASKGAK